jgi:hypothetical protein
VTSALLTALIGFISAVIGTIISHRLIERRSHREFAERYRNKLFDKQLAAYEALWKVLRRTSRYYDDETIFRWHTSSVWFSQSAAREYCKELTEIFFSEHGLYLAKTTRQCMFEVRDARRKISIEVRDEPELTVLPDVQAKHLRSQFQKLTMTVRHDMGLRALRFRPEDIGVDESLLETE